MKLIKRKVTHFKFLVPLVGPCILTDQLKFTPKLNLQYILVDISYLVLKILICHVESCHSQVAKVRYNSF